MNYVKLQPQIQFLRVKAQVWKEYCAKAFKMIKLDLQSHLYQGRMSGRAFFLLACIHPVMSSKGWLNFSSIYVIGQL